MVKCDSCGKDNPRTNKYCDGCGSLLTTRATEPVRKVRPVDSSSLTDFDDDILTSIYQGVTWVPSLSGQLKTTKRRLFSRVEELEAGGFLETTKSFPYREGNVNLHLTPEGYNRVKQLLRQRQPENLGRTEPPAATTPVTQGSQQVTITQKGSDGWKVCGYLCLFLVIVFIVVVVVLAYVGINAFSWIMHLLGLQ